MRMARLDFPLRQITALPLLSTLDTVQRCSSTAVMGIELAYRMGAAKACPCTMMRTETKGSGSVVVVGGGGGATACRHQRPSSAQMVRGGKGKNGSRGPILNLMTTFRLDVMVRVRVGCTECAWDKFFRPRLECEM